MRGFSQSFAVKTFVLCMSLILASVPAVTTAREADPELEFDEASKTLPVGGTALHLLDEGDSDSGDIAILAIGKPQQYLNVTVVGFVFRNNTDQPIRFPDVSGEARGPDGKLIGATTNAQFSRSSWVYSEYVEPGALQFGRIGFDPPLPKAESESAEFTIIVDIDDTSAAFQGVGLTPTEFASTKTTVLGSVRNDADQTAYDIKVYVACFDAQGAFTYIFDGTTSRKTLAPHESSTFSLEKYPGGAQCEQFLITAWGKADPSPF